MDFLKRQLAPLTEEAWQGIDERATDVFKSVLTARKVVRVNGPKGLNHTVIPEGRLTVLESDSSEVCTGMYQVRPLIETRTAFTLDRWELDNIARGARAIKLDALEEAAKKAAMFEENAIFNGFKKGNMEGLAPSAEKSIKFGKDGASIMEAISGGVLALKDCFAGLPLTLVAGEKAWHMVNRETGGYPLSKRIADLIGGEILFSPALDGALLLPYDHEDLEMTLGIDFSIGYQSHDSETVRLFIAESFAFRVLDPALIIKLTL
jgi:uncharacterized linocin/CFP29 family protein